MEQGPGLGEQAVCLGHLGLTLSPGHRVTDQGQCSGPIPGILQARTLEWVAISFSNA